MTRWTNRTTEILIGAALLLCTLAPGCGESGGTSSHGVHDEHADSVEQGPNGGRLLHSGAFALELGLFERGAPPEYRAWASLAGRPLDPAEVDLEVSLTRLGGRVERIAFEPRGDGLVSTSPIDEPHSFEVAIVASHAGAAHEWAFESHEGRSRIDPAMAASLGVETEIAGPATLSKTVTLYGRVRANPERVREIRARFDGVIRAVSVGEGSSVREGQKLLRIESNESLKPYTIVAPISGLVTQRDANPGEQTRGRRLMTVTDTSSVWVDLSVFPVDREGVAVGSPVSIAPALGGRPVTGAVSLLETVADRHDQSVIARVVLDDAGPELLPGTFVTAQVMVGRYEVPLAVKRVGVQAYRDARAVYTRVGDVYEVRPLDIGREAGEWVEVLGGLEPGDRYVTSNSHLLKADIEKSSAAHSH